MAAEMTIPVGSEVSCLSFSPHPLSGDLLAVGTASKICVKSCSIKEEPGAGERRLEDVLSVKHVFAALYDRPAHISWSPASSLADGQFRFCVSGKQGGTITAFSSTQDSTTIESLVGHKGVINDLCTHPSDETLLASVGDDCVCRIWDLQQGQQRSEFKLGSPGMSVRWHECDPVKLLVAERCGRVRIYNVANESPLQSLDCPTPPLITADWAPSNNLVVGGVAGCSWFVWDLSQSSQPLDSKPVHKAPISKFRWCVQNEGVFATLSSSSQLKIHHLAHQRVPVSCDLLSAGDLSWHAQIPVLGVACDREIRCWAVET